MAVWLVGLVTLIERVAQQHVSSTSRTSSEPFSKGLLCELTLARAARGTTLFGTRGMFAGRFRSVPEPFGSTSIGGHAPFEVYAEDPEEARELLGADRLAARSWPSGC